MDFNSSIIDDSFFGLSSVNDAFRTSPWDTGHTGPDCRIEVAPTNGKFSIIGPSSWAQSGTLTTGATPRYNEFGSWMDEHDLFRDALKRIYRECNTDDIMFGLYHTRLIQDEVPGKSCYLIVPTKPIRIMDYAGTPYVLEGIEAGIILMALAWLEALHEHGTTGSWLTRFYGKQVARQYDLEIAGELGTAAHQFETGVRLLD